jgi:DNA-binding SARP family transcriptional activator
MPDPSSTVMMALEFGRRVLASDPLREGVQRSVMLLLVLNGQRADALFAYQRLRALLKADLGIDPMPDTVKLMRDITSGDLFSQIDAYRASYFGEPSAGVGDAA